jgi:signal transduction histidine kinase/DNA-binding response OmpR family regulator
MKRQYLFLLMLLLLFSCSKRTKHYVIGVAQCSEDSWRMKLNEELKRETYFYDNVKVLFSSADDNSDRQIAQINKFIDDGVDLLIISPNEARSITPVVEKAYDKGIPVILVDRKTASDKYTAFIGADNKDIGRTIGKYIATRLRGRGNVVEIQGLKGSSPAIERHNGFMEAVKEYSGIKIISSNHFADWLQKPARLAMDSILAENNIPIDCVFGQNDRMAIGAYESMKQHRPTNKALFIGVDALSTPDGGITAVNKGILTATFIYPTRGDRVMKLAMDILHGRPFQKDNSLNTALVDATNVRILSMQTSEIVRQDQNLETLHGKVDRYFIQYSTQKIYLVLFITIIALLFLFVIYISRAFWTKKQLSLQLQSQKDKIEKQKNELIENNEKLHKLSEEVERATQAKLVFFTNISHEFRTPLTLIADPIDQLLADKKVTPRQSELLHLMKRNINTLLRLVNQLLDFRKIENGKMTLNLCSFDLEESIREWMDEFQVSAKKQHIKLVFEVPAATDFHVVADKEKIQRIFFNLVGNSFKYTPPEGTISVSLNLYKELDNPSFQLSVSDTGIGIKESELPFVFDRFYKSNNNVSGTGIGLALVRALVELQGGKVSVTSVYGKGTTFVMEMPIKQNAELQIAENIAVTTADDETMKTLSTEQISSPEGIKIEEMTEEETMSSSKPTVLVVDDNSDVRWYIRSLLGESYNLIDAADGNDGHIKARKYIPDIIICDVMMPVMDGLELCRLLKSEVETSHIPVIMLTARSLDDQKIEGFNYGADAYIPKPFNGKLLVARIENLLKNREILKSVSADKSKEGNESLSNIDKDFITRFREVVQEHLGDSEFGVEELGSELGFSRVQLYRKIKALTAYSPVELIRTARLKKAKRMIETTDMSVSEIAYSVGFTSPSYFTKCFKEYFNQNPNEVAKER